MEKLEINAEIRINDPTQMRAFLEEEEKILMSYVDKLKALGATALFAAKGIDCAVQYCLAKAGISAVRRVKHSGIEKLVGEAAEKATTGAEAAGGVASAGGVERILEEVGQARGAVAAVNPILPLDTCRRLLRVEIAETFIKRPKRMYTCPGVEQWRCF